MPAAVTQGLRARGHVLEGIDDPYMDFGSGQFIWRLGDPPSTATSAPATAVAMDSPPAIDCVKVTASGFPFHSGVPCMASIGTKSYDAVVAQKVAFLGLGVMGLPMAGHGPRRARRHRLQPHVFQGPGLGR